MAALVCDICGGKLVMGPGGIAVCDSCGMEHSPDRMKEKIQEVKGVVRIDNTHMIDNWMKMGASAAQAGNNKEAYEYFTKVIEVDPSNWRAIFEKGKAGAWQSTLANLRISELYQGIKMALEIIEGLALPEEELISIKNEFAVALFNINNAITDLMDENLTNLDDKYFDIHWDQMWNTRQRYITNVAQLEDALTLIADFTDDLSKSNVIEFKKRMCSGLRNACSSIQYWTSYSQDNLGYLGFKPTEKQQYLDKYWQLVDEIREVEPSFGTEKWSYPDPFGPGLHMSDEIFNYWEKKDAERQEQKRKVAAKKRFDDYWAEHANEKAQYEERIRAIDTEIKDLHETVAQYDAKISDVRKEENVPLPAESQLAEMKRQQADLVNQKGKLGLFSGKQKKELHGQIDTVQAQISTFEESVKQQKKSMQNDIAARVAPIEAERQPYLDKISVLENEKCNIKAELTKER